MNIGDFDQYVHALNRAGVIFEPGLSIEEVRQIEERYRFHFPPDYCAFLMNALPVSDASGNRGHGFVDWRNATEALILHILTKPYEGICFDIEVNRFWLNRWGPRPVQLENALAIAQDDIKRAPILIPVFGHRYIPSKPEEAGNPIFSVVQTDIIYYGSNLGEYLANEFGYSLFRGYRHQIAEPVKRIEFWSEMVDENNRMS